MNGKEEVKKEEEHEGTLQINETRGAFKFRPNYCLFSKWREEASMPRLSTWPYEVICCSHDSDSVVRHIPLFVSQNKMSCFLSFHQGGFPEDHSFMMLKGTGLVLMSIGIEIQAGMGPSMALIEDHGTMLRLLTLCLYTQHEAPGDMVLLGGLEQHQPSCLSPSLTHIFPLPAGIRCCQDS